MKNIQEWLGHSNFNTTADVYSHLDYTAKYESAKAISTALAKTPEKPISEKVDKIDEIDELELSKKILTMKLLNLNENLKKKEKNKNEENAGKKIMECKNTI